MAIFVLLLQLGIIDYRYIFINNMNYYCVKFYTNISTNMDTTNIFQFLSIFAHNFYYFPPKYQILDLFSLTS